MNSKTLINGFKCIFYLLGTLIVALPVQAASFDCAKARTKVEHLICDNPEISKLDDELAASYKNALNDPSKAESIKKMQRAWLIQRNRCEIADCVKLVYEKRLASTDFMPISSNANGTSEGASVDNSKDLRRYQFQLTKGKGIPVCDAYLKRLNTTEFTSPPYCGRPETTSVPGFALLNRIPLLPEAVHAIFPRVNKFVLSGKQGNKEEDEAYEALLKRNGAAPSIDPVSTMQEFIQKDEMKVWRYDPQVDVNNDGSPDNILMWQGYGLGSPLGTCGRTVDFGGRSGDNQPQLAFILAGTQDRLNTEMTRDIFGHPSGGYRLANGKMAPGFRPIGFSMGIFEYQNIYYFDTFFDFRGDFQNKRKNDPELKNTLGVFLRKNGKTKQVCEYRMNKLNWTSGESRK